MNKAEVLAPGPVDRDFVRVGKSRIAGRELFAKRRIPLGARILEYGGMRVLRADLPADLAAGRTSGTYVMCVNEKFVIDGERGGNDARFVNHGCQPNCEVLFFGEVAYLYALADIPRWTELTFDYRLRPSRGTRPTRKELQALLPCTCGSRKCRGSMFVP